ncbi:hypothetical protein [Roseinatronobacter monicus]|uniref:hypothetical protein n=1 Tax=Roseinatronobacter monicus TaxID=393481 RepID=UPI003F37CEEB
MSEIVETQTLVARSIKFWSGIDTPNPAAEEMSGHFLSARDEFANLRGKARFEEEPASFLAALQSSKERME